MKTLIHVFASALVALLLAAIPSGAQEAVPGDFWRAQPWVEQGSFTMLGNALTIDVDTEGPGTLLVLRGRDGRVAVRARADGGVAALALSNRGRARLSLSGLDSERLMYVVVVPERARVTVRLPDRDLSEGLTTHQRSATFRWEAPAPERDPVEVPSPGRTPLR